MNTDQFASRHLGIRPKDLPHMLKTIGADSLDQLIEQTVPDDIRLEGPMDLDPPMSEYEFLEHIGALAGENKIFKSYIGMGYHACITPSVIKRNILENPGWYTAYTPYQAEASQGTLQLTYEYQSMMTALTAMDVSNASMYDGASSLAEAILMAVRANRKSKSRKIVVGVGLRCTWCVALRGPRGALCRLLGALIR